MAFKKQLWAGLFSYGSNAMASAFQTRLQRDDSSWWLIYTTVRFISEFVLERKEQDNDHSIAFAHVCTFRSCLVRIRVKHSFIKNHAKIFIPYISIKTGGSDYMVNCTISILAGSCEIKPSSNEWMQSAIKKFKSGMRQQWKRGISEREAKMKERLVY